MAIEKQQFELPLSATRRRPSKLSTPRVESRERALPERIVGIDQVLSTQDIVRITGRHRCTIYRWVRAGTFPERRAGGGRGWLRSDVERWLQEGSASEGAPPLRKSLETSGTR